MEIEGFIEQTEQKDKKKSEYDFLFAEQWLLEEPSGQESPEGESVLLSICKTPTDSVSGKGPIESEEAEICLFAAVPSKGGQYEILKKYSFGTPEEYAIDSTGTTLAYPSAGFFRGTIEVDQKNPLGIISSSQAYHTLVVGKKTLKVADLGWNREKASEARARFSSFEEAWDDPALDVYNDL